MITRRQSLALAAGSLAAGWAGASAAQAAPSLHDLAQRSGRRFGSAVGAGAPGTLTASFDNARYRQLLERECGVLVHENELKWYVLRPEADRFVFGPADRIAGFAAERGMGLRGHTLIWHHPQWFPAWTTTHDYGARPAAEVERLVLEHIDAIIDRYGAIDSWDVINEAVDPADGSLRVTPFSQRMGGPEAVMDLAFRRAREKAPGAQLVYNDYMSWEAGHETHQAGVLRLLEGFRARGVPCDALGVQSHIGSGNADDSVGFDTARDDNWRRFLDEVVGMGYDLVITEFDVHDRNLPADVPARDAAVAALARRYLDLMLSYPQMGDILCWGLSDQHTWLQDRWLRDDRLPKRPTPYDADYRPKPLREAIAAALRDATPRRTA
ncbi:MAG TPA: endo-1,4-beta-xylanase [Brevundimonas sp.]|jgi:endo-1,4-beta-xylanase|uniref:endo-1,4-beta-xylanase n=1 Tax=Brevundimonas sp. TaxID=1871086 RepID=UPI002E0DF3B1|nr:endo-1,4-beta-xylanase [Brevundimonas sp.]